MPHHVFISYSSHDKQTAEAVCGALEATGVRCWIAPRDILPGVPYGEALSDAIDECCVMVLVLSAHSNVSRQVMLEVEGAVDKDISILPLRIEELQLSKSLRHFLKSIHWFDALVPPMERHLPQLVEVVKQLLIRQGAALPDSSRHNETAPAGTMPMPTSSLKSENNPTRDEGSIPGHSASAANVVGEGPSAFSAPSQPRAGGDSSERRRRVTATFDNSLGNRLVLVAPPYLASGSPSTQSMYVSTTCVSNADYQAFVRAGGEPPHQRAGKRKQSDHRAWDWRADCPSEMLRHPVVYVTHANARRFCEWLTNKEKSVGRIESHELYALPTAVQWQSFARGVKLTAKTVLERQWQPGHYQPTEPVDWPDLGPLGISCLLGNVFEWCGDPPMRRKVKASRPDGSVAMWDQDCCLAVGGGWASGCEWLDEGIRKGTFGRIWCPGGNAMKDGGFRICLISCEPSEPAV